MITKELPKYKCTKTVWALKIESVTDLEDPKETEGTPKALITPVNKEYAPFEVSSEFMWKHKPVAGGYYVVYSDGYTSFSPAKAFEEGYNLCE